MISIDLKILFLDKTNPSTDDVNISSKTLGTLDQKTLET